MPARLSPSSKRTKARPVAARRNGRFSSDHASLPAIASSMLNRRISWRTDARTVIGAGPNAGKAADEAA